MKLMKSQKGLSVLSWLLVLAIVGFLASTVFKMFPHYIDNMALEKMILSAETDKAAQVNSPAALYDHVQKGMQVNGIRDIKLEEAMTVEVDGNDMFVHLKYERREPMVGNLDLVARFEKEIRVRIQ